MLVFTCHHLTLACGRQEGVVVVGALNQNFCLYAVGGDKIGEVGVAVGIVGIVVKSEVVPSFRTVL